MAKAGLFGSAASAQKPQMVLDALHSAYTDLCQCSSRFALSLEASTDAYEAVRGKVAKFIHATDEKEVVFTSGATMSLNLIAHSYGNTYLKAGDEVLITVAEHHANIVPWHLLGERVGSRTIAAPVNPDGSFDMEVFKSYITERTKIISIPHVSNVLGTVFPVQEIAALAAKMGQFAWWMAVRALPICR